MRNAECINNLQITVAGEKGSRLITRGWRGDLDEVLGVQVIPEKRDREDPTKILEPERRVEVTVADMLGHHLTEANFTVDPPPGKKGPAASPAAGAPPKE